MAMAGLIQEQTKQAVNGLPGLDQLPVLGALFAGLRQQPDRTDGSGDALCGSRGGAEGTVPPRRWIRAGVGDSQSTLLARINRIYGLVARVDTIGAPQGNFGFIID